MADRRPESSQTTYSSLGSMDAAAIKKAYDGLFDEVSAAILVVLPPDGRIVSVNAEAEELTGYEKAELEAMSFTDIFRLEDRSRITSIFEAPVNYSFQKLFEHNVIIQKRSKRKIVVDMGFRLASIGTKEALVFTLQDITDLRANQQRVQRAHQYINNIVQSVRETLLVVDADGVIKTANEAALHMLGYTRKEIIGKRLDRLISDTPESRPYKREILERRNLAEVEVMFKTKSGKQVPVLLSASEMKGSGADKKDRIVIVAMDITERIKAEQLIDEQQVIIVQTAKMSSLGEMASGIAHEINNPLHVIVGCCDMLNLLLNKEKSENTDIRESVTLIQNMSQRIQKIVLGLKAFSRDQANDPLELSKLSTIVHDTMALCEQRIRKRGVVLEVAAIPDHLMLECHPTMISQVLLNLLNNSYDSIENDEKSWIKLEFKEKRGEVIISVTDSGPRIKEETARNIFKPFFTTKAVGKGTGLGLSISKSVIESHHGTLTYDLKSPHAKFVLTLPLASQVAKKDGNGEAA